MRIKTHHWTWITLVVVGCTADPSLEEHDDAQERAVAEIVANLERAGYPAAEIVVEDDGRVFVGGDAQVTLSASREMIGRSDRRGDRREASAEQFRQYRTNNLVSSAVTSICVDGSAVTGLLSGALDAAIESYDGLDLSFEMRRTSGSVPGCDAEITVAVVSGGGGSAGFPSGGLPFSSVEIGQDVADFGEDVATHVITHELGHCIGFRHTDYFDRSISCGTGGDEGQAGVGAIHIPGTPTGATFDGSVMNSCFNAGSTGQLAQDDVDALLELYAALPSPPPPPPPGGSCEGRCGGYDPMLSCQCDDACDEYDDCCEDEALVCDPPPPQPQPDSCVAACGGNAGACWCDTLCFLYGDCCGDFAEQC